MSLTLANLSQFMSAEDPGHSLLSWHRSNQRELQHAENNELVFPPWPVPPSQMNERIDKTQGWLSHFTLKGRCNRETSWTARLAVEALKKPRLWNDPASVLLGSPQGNSLHFAVCSSCWTAHLSPQIFISIFTILSTQKVFLVGLNLEFCMNLSPDTGSHIRFSKWNENH